MAGFETSSRPYLLIYGDACHHDVIVRYSFANTKKLCEDFFFIASLLARVEQPWTVRGIKALLLGGAITIIIIIIIVELAVELRHSLIVHILTVTSLLSITLQSVWE